jgi:hypothetical protein
MGIIHLILMKEIKTWMDRARDKLEQPDHNKDIIVRPCPVDPY